MCLLVFVRDHIKILAFSTFKLMGRGNFGVADPKLITTDKPLSVL